MAFPIWTLWGMGVSAGLTLLFLVLAYVAQSPGLLLRLGLTGYRLDLRVRAFTGYALASLLLAGGFFLAGVPLPQLDSDGSEAASVVRTPPSPLSSPAATPLRGTPSSTAATDEDGESAGLEAASPLPTDEAVTSAGTTPETGAFAGPPGGTATAEVEPTATETAAAATPTPTAPATTPTVTLPPTSTATATATSSPTPTMTPTPIEGETAVIDTGSSTLWVRRSPGGQTLALVRGGDTVILWPGHANQGGILWREISTVSGDVGWVQEEFLLFDGS